MGCRATVILFLEKGKSFVLHAIIRQLANEKANKVRKARRLAFQRIDIAFAKLKHQSGIE